MLVPPGEQDGELFTILPDGTEVQQLTNDLVREQDPAWSPDGSKLVFTIYEPGHLTSIFTIDADGSDLRFVARGHTLYPHPSFSKSGRRILYTTFTKLVTVRADGSGGRRVIRSVPSMRDGGFSDPTFSPDGRWIAFSGIPRTGAKPGIWKMRRDGTHAKRLTRSDDRHGSFADTMPDFSPDGRWIVYWRDPSVVKLMRANGRHKQAIPGTAMLGWPSFSPAGDRIVMDYQVSGPVKGWVGPGLCGDLFTMSPDGSDLHNVTRYTVGFGICRNQYRYAPEPIVPRAAAWQPLPAPGP